MEHWIFANSFYARKAAARGVNLELSRWRENVKKKYHRSLVHFYVVSEEGMTVSRLHILILTIDASGQALQSWST